VDLNAFVPLEVVVSVFEALGRTRFFMFSSRARRPLGD